MIRKGACRYTEVAGSFSVTPMQEPVYQSMHADSDTVWASILEYIEVFDSGPTEP